MKQEEIKQLLKEGKIYIPLTNDNAFKSVLTQNPYYVIDIVFKLFNIKEDIYKQKYYIKNSELIKNGIKEKKKVADLIFEIGDMVVNLEMNKEYYKDIIIKNNRYLYKLIDSKLKKGDKYNKEDKIYIQINFDNYNLFNKSISYFDMLDIETKEPRRKYVKHTNDPIIVHVSLPILYKKYYNKEKLSELEKELLLMILTNKKEIKEIIKGNKIMKEVAKSMEKLTYEEEMNGIYLKEEYDKWVRECLIRDAKEDGFEKGIEQGKKVGEDNKSIEIAKVLLDNNVDINIITKSTGLSISKLKELNKN